MDKTQLSVSAFGGQDMTTVNINKGDIFIGRGDLIHAGMPYDTFNVRLHMYFDYPKCGRSSGAKRGSPPKTHFRTLGGEGGPMGERPLLLTHEEPADAFRTNRRSVPSYTIPTFGRGTK